MAKGKVYIGTSGWSYSNWKGGFYPDKTKAGDFLAYYSTVFNTTELNSSFYRLPQPKMIESWANKVPKDFKFSVKLSRYLTHIKRLKEPDEPLERFFTLFEHLKANIGMVLAQLPPTLQYNAEVAERFYSLLKEGYSDYSFAMEGRHISWLSDESLQQMEQYGVSFVMSNSNNLFPYGEYVTAKNIYIRFHGPGKLFDSSYSDEVLADYAAKIIRWQKAGHTVWVYFNNTMREAGYTNAKTLIGLL